MALPGSLAFPFQARQVVTHDSCGCEWLEAYLLIMRCAYATFSLAVILRCLGYFFNQAVNNGYIMMLHVCYEKTNTFDLDPREGHRTLIGHKVKET